MSNNEHMKLADNSVMDISNDSNIRFESSIISDENNASDRNLNVKINDSISCVNTSSENLRIAVSVYGNDIRIENPFKIGKCFSFLYFKGYPVITVGPECKNKKYKKYFFLKNTFRLYEYFVIFYHNLSEFLFYIHCFSKIINYF